MKRRTHLLLFQPVYIVLLFIKMWTQLQGAHGDKPYHSYIISEGVVGLRQVIRTHMYIFITASFDKDANQNLEIYEYNGINIAWV
jgi:hypothetical protein